MNRNLIQIARQREFLARELSQIRHSSLIASRKGDFRIVARLTLEAARVNRAIVESDVQAELAL